MGPRVARVRVFLRSLDSWHVWPPGGPCAPRWAAGGGSAGRGRRCLRAGRHLRAHVAVDHFLQAAGSATGFPFLRSHFHGSLEGESLRGRPHEIQG